MATVRREEIRCIYCRNPFMVDAGELSAECPNCKRKMYVHEASMIVCTLCGFFFTPHKDAVEWDVCPKCKKRTEIEAGRKAYVERGFSDKGKDAPHDESSDDESEEPLVRVFASHLFDDVHIHVGLPDGSNLSLDRGWFTKTVQREKKDEVYDVEVMRCWVPIRINEAVSRGDTILIFYQYAGRDKMQMPHEAAAELQKLCKLTSMESNTLMAFFSHYIMHKIETNEIVKITDVLGIPTIDVDETGIIHVTPGKMKMDFDMKSVLDTILKMVALSTFPDAFSLCFAYALISPLQYFIKGWRGTRRFPGLIFFGRTHGGKSSMIETTVGLGYGLIAHGDNLEIRLKFGAADLGTSQFRFGKISDSSVFPVLFDDLDPQFFTEWDSILKQYTDSPDARLRGDASGNVTSASARRALMMTINDFLEPSLALKERYCAVQFLETHSAKQNLPEFDKLRLSLPIGYMVPLLIKCFDGKNIADVITEMYREAHTDRDIVSSVPSYAMGLWTKIFGEYGLENKLCLPRSVTMDVFNWDEQLIDWVLTQSALNIQYSDGVEMSDGSRGDRPPVRPDVTAEHLRVRPVDGRDGWIEVALSISGYAVFVARTRCPYGHATTFINNSRLPNVRYAEFKRHETHRAIIFEIPQDGNILTKPSIQTQLPPGNGSSHMLTIRFISDLDDLDDDNRWHTYKVGDVVQLPEKVAIQFINLGYAVMHIGGGNT